MRIFSVLLRNRETGEIIQRSALGHSSSHAQEAALVAMFQETLGSDCEWRRVETVSAQEMV